MTAPLRHSIVLLAACLPVAAALLVLTWWRQPIAVDSLAPQLTELRLDLNEADSPKLQLLPGVGSSLARAIVEHRTRAGGFSSVAQLEDVARVGPVTRAQIEPWVSVPGGAAIHQHGSLRPPDSSR